ncbi:DUF6415 family natural product biosynthesis protein [Streptomyces sp. NPDC004237]|uniref:DUF6415 family natural product biosynthesis protein n=1 Tax=Streptomyces sp. NPDC004237 TaxID=3154455 RepID=UPI00339FDE90
MTQETALMRSAAGMRLAPAGVRWDVVKVARHTAVRAIDLIETPGAVAVDPAPAEAVLYFFVPPGSAAEWHLPQTTALGLNAHVVLPPPGREAPPGPYWLIGPTLGLTPAIVLRKALGATLETTTNPVTVDIDAMRRTAAILLDPDAFEAATAPSGLDTLTKTLLGHLEALAPIIEQSARTLCEESIRRRTALVCVWEARSRLESTPRARTGGSIGHTRRLARALAALCDQYERIGGAG